jgi:hypothetical protein
MKVLLSHQTCPLEYFDPTFKSADKSRPSDCVVLLIVIHHFVTYIFYLGSSSTIPVSVLLNGGNKNQQSNNQVLTQGTLFIKLSRKKNRIAFCSSSQQNAKITNESPKLDLTEWMAQFSLTNFFDRQPSNVILL